MCGFTLPPQSSRLIIAAMLSCGLVLVQAPPCSLAAEDESTTITSRTMTAEGDSRRAIFEGTVVLKKGNFVMRSDHMIVLFGEDRHNQNRQTEARALSRNVEHIEATGNVVLEKSKGRATSGRAIYYKDEAKIVLTESPVAWHNGTKVTGFQMTIFLKEERSVVEGGSQVVIFDDLDDQGQ